MIGPGEFDADTPYQRNREWHSTPEAAQVAEIYRLLRADAVYVSPQAGAWFAPAATPLPESFWLPHAEPVSRIFDFNGRKVGVIFFRNPEQPGSGVPSGSSNLSGPSGKPAHPESSAAAGTSSSTATAIALGGAKTPLPQRAARGPLTQAEQEIYAPFIEEAITHGRRLGSQVDLLIGVSPWGNRVEQSFMEQAAGLYHILLGGGSGMSFPYASTAAGYPLIWSRPYPEGRSVNLIKLYEWPQPGFSQWTPEIGFSANFEDLGPSVPSDPEIARLLPQF